MWKAKLTEKNVVSVFIFIVGIGHAITYVLKTDKCNACGNYVDSEVVKWFHVSNYTMWLLLFYAVLISNSFKKCKFVFLLGALISEYLLFNEVFGEPKDWSVPVIAGSVLVVALALVKGNVLNFKKKLYI